MRRALLFMAFTIVGVMLALMLGGCANPQLLKGSGAPAGPPLGYIIECGQHPELENCKP